LKLKLEPWTSANSLLNKRLQKTFPHFEDLHVQIKKSGIPITFSAYVSFMFFISIIAFVASLVTSLALLPLIMKVSFISLSNLLLSPIFAGTTFLITFMLIYIYPSIKANSRKGPIEKNMPYITSFLTLLSSSNVPPSVIFRSVGQIPTLKEVRLEFTNIVRDVEIFGKDLMTSILENAKYTPSNTLKEILIGYVATVRTGGNPTEYLRIANENVTRERMGKLDLMLESLSALAEIYIMVLVAMPLLFVVLLATLGMIGSAGTALNPALFLYLLTYVGIPIMGAVMMILVSTMEK